MEDQGIRPRDEIYGVDFSGGEEAGRKIWVTAGRIRDDGLLIEDCIRGVHLPHSGPGRKQAVAALRDFIRARKNAIFGMDFPFGVAKELMGGETWEEFIETLPAAYPDPDVFRKEVIRGGESYEPKRQTDEEARTPFAPTNLRLFRQTYFGIKEILNPLVTRGDAVALPMQPAKEGVAWLIEVCPASTLKNLNLYLSYKGRSEFQLGNRIKILDSLADMFDITPAKEGIRETILEDDEGDTLDSLIAAVVVAKVAKTLAAQPEPEMPYKVEGKVYY